MKKLILTIGLPRSGKSTWASKQGCPVVNRDAIRLALHGQPYLQDAEDMVSSIEMYMVKSLFLGCHDTVIVDATHLKKKYRDRWECGSWEIQYHALDTPKDICITRAKSDDKEYLIPIIERMSENVEWPNDSD